MVAMTNRPSCEARSYCCTQYPPHFTQECVSFDDREDVYIGTYQDVSLPNTKLEIQTMVVIIELVQTDHRGWPLRRQGEGFRLGPACRGM